MCSGGQQHVPLVEKWRELSLLRLRGELVVACNHPMEKYKDSIAKFFSTVANNKRGGDDSLLFGRPGLDFREDSHRWVVVWCWNRLPREAVESPSPEFFETWLNKATAAHLFSSNVGDGLAQNRMSDGDLQMGLPVHVFQ